ERRVVELEHPASISALGAAPPNGGRFEALPLLTERTRSTLGNQYDSFAGAYREPAYRPRAGHTRPAHPEDARPRADERLDDQPAPQAALRRRAAGQRRLAVPRAAQARAGRLDQGRVAPDREQPPREVLFADPARQEGPGQGDRGLAAPVGRDLACRRAEGGLADAHRAVALRRAHAPAHAPSARRRRAGARRGAALPRRAADRGLRRRRNVRRRG